MRTPSRASAAHYHVHLACLRAADPSFVSSTLVIPPDLATFHTVQHKELLLLEFGLHLLIKILLSESSLWFWATLGP